MAQIEDFMPVTQDNVLEAVAFVFAPWVLAMGLKDFEISEGRAAAVLPQDPSLQFFTGAICGQTLMAAIDTVTALAMATTSQASKGTVYQHTHFLRPAAGEDLRVEAQVLRFGRATAYAEARVVLIGSGALAAHAVLEFAF